MTRKPLKSRSVRVVLAGATALSLAACNEEKADETSIFPDLAACLAETEKPGSWYTPEECRAAFATAEAEHARTAPHYADRALCEEQHGGACEIQQDSSGGSFFMPLMAGYLMGNLMSNNAASMRATPLVSTKAGKLSTADGSSTFARKSGPVSTSAKTFSAKPSTVKMAPMTKASVKSTGGFGATRTASPSIRSTGRASLGG